MVLRAGWKENISTTIGSEVGSAKEEMVAVLEIMKMIV
jgi:hypothetical protein